MTDSRSLYRLSSLWAVLIASLLAGSIAAEDEETVTGRIVKLDERLMQALPTVLVTQDPDIVYGRTVVYEAYPLAGILNRAYPDWKQLVQQDAVLILRAHGGYEPFMVFSDGFLGYAYVTKQIADRPGDSSYDCWIEGGSEHCDLGYFLIWTDAFYPERPQPWGITEIEVVSFATAFGLTVPNTRDPAVQAGFETYKKYCIECHRINGQGGAKATDHVVRPAPLTAEQLAFFVRDFRKINPATYMPDFSEILTSQELAELLDYIDHMHYKQNLCDSKALSSHCPDK